MENEFHNAENFPEIHESIYLVEAIWIIEKKSGICIFDHYYGEKENSEISSDLICGFFSAFLDISEQFFGQHVDYIKLRDSRLYFTFVSNAIFIIKFEDDILLDEEIEEIVFDIANTFISEYRENLIKWNGNLQEFEDFTTILNEIVSIHPFYIYFN